MLLSPSVTVAVLFATLLHAGWNIVVRAGAGRRWETALVVAGGAVLTCAVLPFLKLSPMATWRYVLTSAGLNAVHFVPIAAAYARGGVALGWGGALAIAAGATISRLA